MTACGEERPLTATVDRAAYSIVEEGDERRAPRGPREGGRPTPHHSIYDLTISVVDDGGAYLSRRPPPASASPGCANAFTASATLHAAPRTQGGFSVRAELPLGDPEEAP